jgi:hypothetical protein
VAARKHTQQQVFWNEKLSEEQLGKLKGYIRKLRLDVEDELSPETLMTINRSVNTKNHDHVLNLQWLLVDCKFRLFAYSGMYCFMLALARSDQHYTSISIVRLVSISG